MHHAITKCFVLRRSFDGRPVACYVVIAILNLFVPRLVFAQASSDRQVQIHSADATTEMRLVQVEQALSANELGDAISQLQKIADESDGKLIAFPPESLSESFPITRYVPLDTKVAWQRNHWSNAFPEALRQYRSTIDPTIRQRLDQIGDRPDLPSLQQLANDARASSYEVEALTRLGDLYLYRGWTNAARDCYQHTSTALRAPVGTGNKALTSIPWHFILRKFTEDPNLPDSVRSFFQNPPQTSLGDGGISAPPSFDIGARLVWCSVLDGDFERARLERRLVAECIPGTEVDRQQWLGKIDGWLEASAPTVSLALEDGPTTFAANRRRNATIPTEWSLSPNDPARANWGNLLWDQRLPRRSGTYEQMPDGLPRASESSQGLLGYHPVPFGNRVFVNVLNRILAFELESGKGWPSPTSGLSLYEHNVLEDQIAPIGYPIIGVPRGTLSILDDKLYARVGIAITGWRNPSEFATESQSALVGLDLRSEGRMIPGFPIRLSGENWTNCEFEGSPVLVGDNLFVGVTQRNSVQLRRFIACFDRFTAQLRWRSPLLAAALPHRAEQANVISSQLISYSSGRLFYDTGLGAIAALDAANGNISWLVRYARVDAFAEAYPRSQRFRQRDLTPPLIFNDMIICAPQDCREIFALDWSTGDLLWATEPGVASDVVHVLGTQKDTLFASGDRLYWLDVWTGRQLARYPESGSDLPGHALPSPRGMGRGLVTNHAVLWPVAGKLLSFDVALERKESGRNVVKPPWEIDLGTRMGEGANVVSDGKWIILATPSRLMAFQPIATPQ